MSLQPVTELPLKLNAINLDFLKVIGLILLGHAIGVNVIVSEGAAGILDAAQNKLSS